MNHNSNEVSNRFRRAFLAMFFVVAATLKAVGLFDSSPPPDIAGIQLAPAVVVLIIAIEALLGVLLLSRFYAWASTASLLLFLGFAVLATAELLGWVTTTRCGCFGSVNLGSQRSGPRKRSQSSCLN